MADGEYTDFDDMIERTHRSVDAFVAGDPEPNKRLWSRSDDVALANPFGGSGGVGRVLKKCDPGREFCLGDVARVVGSDLAYVFEIQGFDAKLPGREMPLRVTRRRV